MTLRKAAALLFVLSVLNFVHEANAQYVPPRGFVPDAATAIAIARAVLVPIYGADTIRGEEPLVAAEKTNSWIVHGTLQCAPGCVGGTAEIEIAKRDGRILHVTHYK